jgi:hypothetical protein
VLHVSPSAVEYTVGIEHPRNAQQTTLLFSLRNPSLDAKQLSPWLETGRDTAHAAGLLLEMFKASAKLRIIVF